MVLNQVCQSLHKNGINKIYVGQDFNNFFSGIPDPDEGKEIFFKKNEKNLQCFTKKDIFAKTI